MAEPPPPPEAPRGTSWVSQVYFYLAALIGLVIVITGVLIALNALIDAIFFDPPARAFTRFHGDRSDKLKNVLQGLVTAGVGAPIFWWHLQQARKSD